MDGWWDPEGAWEESKVVIYNIIQVVACFEKLGLRACACGCVCLRPFLVARRLSAVEIVRRTWDWCLAGVANAPPCTAKRSHATGHQLTPYRATATYSNLTGCPGHADHLKGKELPGYHLYTSASESHDAPPKMSGANLKFYQEFQASVASTPSPLLTVTGNRSLILYTTVVFLAITEGRANTS